MRNDFINSEKTKETITNEVINLMNVLKLVVNNVDVIQLIESHSVSLKGICN